MLEGEDGQRRDGSREDVELSIGVGSYAFFFSMSCFLFRGDSHNIQLKQEELQSLGMVTFGPQSIQLQSTEGLNAVNRHYALGYTIHA